MPATPELKKAKDITSKMKDIAENLQKKYKDDSIEEGDVLVGLGKLLQLKQNLLDLLDEMDKAKTGRPGSFQLWYLDLKHLDEAIDSAKSWAESWWTFLVTEGFLEIHLNSLSFSASVLDIYVDALIRKK